MRYDLVKLDPANIPPVESWTLVARKAGIAKETANKAKSGRPVSARTAKRIAKALGVKLSDLGATPVRPGENGAAESVGAMPTIPSGAADGVRGFGIDSNPGMGGNGE